jgi:hypothetical protein
VSTGVKIVAVVVGAIACGFIASVYSSGQSQFPAQELVAEPAPITTSMVRPASESVSPPGAG